MRHRAMMWLLCLPFLMNAAHAEEPKALDWAVVPLVNFTTDRGVGYGLYGAIFTPEQDAKGPPPYAMQVGAQFYQTTGGYSDHKLVLDLPRLADDRLRLELTAGLENWDGAFYFGQGGNLPRLRPEDTPEQFYSFGLQSLRVISKARFPLNDSFDGFVGHVARSANIAIYPGSKLSEDQPVGSEGGLLSQVMAGTIYDVRDHELTPTEGMYTELSARLARSWMGSHFDMWGINLTDRRFYTLGHPRVVLALREGVDFQQGEVPFFHQPVLGGSQWVEVGGPLAMRGLSVGRYRANLTLIGDTEIRWEASRFSLRRSELRWFLVSFASAASFHQPGEEVPDLSPHGGIGAGTRLLYNEVFMMRLDVGFGREKYMDGQTITGAWAPGVYLAFNSPF